MIVLFEVAPGKLIRDAALFGWDLRELERAGRLRMVFTTRQLFQQGLEQADSPLLAEAAEIGARRIFVDGLVRLPEPSGRDLREAFHVLAEGLHREGLTAMLALESRFDEAAAARAPEEFVADTIIRVSVEPVQRAVLRSLEIVKSRGHELPWVVTRSGSSTALDSRCTVASRRRAACSARRGPPSTPPRGWRPASPASTNW